MYAHMSYVQSPIHSAQNHTLLARVVNVVKPPASRTPVVTVDVVARCEATSSSECAPPEASLCPRVRPVLKV